MKLGLKPQERNLMEKSWNKMQEPETCLRNQKSHNTFWNNVSGFRNKRGPVYRLQEFHVTQNRCASSYDSACMVQYIE